MKQYAIFLSLLIGFQLTLFAQKSKSEKTTPKEDIRVNREYDENGNLIKFDSIYSYSWSGDTTLQNTISPESLQNLFGDHLGVFSDSTFFGHSIFDDFDRSFFSPFGSKNDSILSKTPGMPPFQQQQKTMDEMMKILQQQMKEMEELQRKFLKEEPKVKELKTL